jgi:3-phytase
VVETEPVPSGGDAADDAAIWVSRDRPRRSTVIGTDKQGGIAVYDLAGRQLQYRPDGDINNVDLRDVALPGGRRTALVAATNRTTQTVDLYRVDPEKGILKPLQPGIAAPDLAVNGICMYRDPGARRDYGFFVTGLRGEVEQWRLTWLAGGRLRAKPVATFSFGGPTEACVVDEAGGRAYFAEERVGIWSVPLGGRADRPRRVAAVSDDGPLVADVEGLAVLRRPGADLLIASSQGNNSYATYRVGSATYAGSYVIAAGEIDGTEETDGLDVTAEPLGPRFPHGLLVVQDDRNDGGNQNFKLVRLCRRPDLSCDR